LRVNDELISHDEEPTPIFRLQETGFPGIW
jgi:hypothetical protein